MHGDSRADLGRIAVNGLLAAENKADIPIFLMRRPGCTTWPGYRPRERGIRDENSLISPHRDRVLRTCTAWEAPC